jgi:hypothetical protein
MEQGFEGAPDQGFQQQVGDVPQGSPAGPTMRDWAMQPEAQEIPVDDYRSKIAEMEPGDHLGTVRHPFRTIDREAYLAAIRGAGVAKRTQSAPIAKIRLSDVVAIQGSVNAERLGHHLDEPRLYQQGARAPGHGMVVDLPVIVKKNGMYFVHDGHHRLTARHLRGLDTAKVRLVDLDGP